MTRWRRGGEAQDNNRVNSRDSDVEPGPAESVILRDEESGAGAGQPSVNNPTPDTTGEPDTQPDAHSVGRGPSPDTRNPPGDFYTQDSWFTTDPDTPHRTGEDALAAQISAIMAQVQRAVTRRPGDPRTLDLLLRAAATLRRLVPNERKKLAANLELVLKNFHDQLQPPDARDPP